MAATKEDFLSAITKHGLLQATASFFSKLGCDGEVKALEEFNHDGKINLVQLILSVPKTSWKGKDTNVALYVLRKIIKLGCGLPVKDVLAIAYTIWTMVGPESDHGLTSNALAAYVGSHTEVAEDVGDCIFNDVRYTCFASGVFPYLDRIDHDKWSSRLFDWFDKSVSPFHIRVGISIFGELEITKYGSRVEGIYERTANALSLIGIKEVGLAVYFASTHWKQYKGTCSERFENLILSILKSGDGIVKGNIAFLEREKVADASLDEIKSRLSAFAVVTPDDEWIYNVDCYLAEVVKVAPEVACEFLEDKIAAYYDVAARKDVFKETFAAMFKYSEDFRSLVITRWLLSPRDHMLLAVQKLSGVSQDSNDLRAHVIPDEVEAVASVRVNLLRQSIARLFHSFRCCVSYAMSCLSLLTDDEILFIESDFYQMIVMNYPDVVAQECKTGLYDKRTVDFVQKQLNEFESMKKLVSDVKCSELEPSSDDRLAYAKIEQKRNEEIIAEAKKASIFSLFGPELKILYGNGAIYERSEGIDGQKSRQEMTFNGIRTQIRIPALMKFYDMTLQTKLDELSYSRVTFNA